MIGGQWFKAITDAFVAASNSFKVTLSSNVVALASNVVAVASVVLPTVLHVGTVEASAEQVENPVQLHATQALKAGCSVRALDANASAVLVGGPDVEYATGYALAAGESIFIEIDDLSKLYMYASEEGDGVSYCAT